jgi:hypothetical protein
MKERIMNIKHAQLVIMVLALPILVSWESANAQGCAGDPACIEIIFGDDLSEAPKVNPEVLYVEQKVRNHFKRVRFYVDGPDSLTHATIQFKCNKDDKYCRYKSPFAPESERWIEEFDVHRGRSNNLPIANHLPDCDHECALTDKECIKKRCTYSYSIHNHKGEMVLDPDTVMEPK